MTLKVRFFYTMKVAPASAGMYVYWSREKVGDAAWESKIPEETQKKDTKQRHEVKTQSKDGKSQKRRWKS